LNSREWKAFYEAERRRLGEGGLLEILDRAPHVTLPSRGALIFPHTRLELSGELIAASARAVIDAGADEVLALGVLHGARECDAELVRAARAGDTRARERLRRVHGPGVANDGGYCQEEFSLDSFKVLVDLAARRAGRRAPKIIERYPFLTGDSPHDLPGIDELRETLKRGAALVATTDPVHHGTGYGTPRDELLPLNDAKTVAVARESIDYGFGLLGQRKFTAFLQHAKEVHSDFRDDGPVLAELLDGFERVELVDLKLVDYSDVVGEEPPTWVAAGLALIS
jgi:hypothetical protein